MTSQVPTAPAAATVGAGHYNIKFIIVFQSRSNIQADSHKEI
jgi:hypothetical protein